MIQFNKLTTIIILTFLGGFSYLKIESIQAISEFLKILDIYVGETSVAFDIKDVNLPQNEVYFMECIEFGNDLHTNNPQQIRQQIPNNPSNHIQMMVGNLKKNTKYNCYVAVKKSSGQFVRPTKKKTIITGKPLCSNPYILYQGDCVEPTTNCINPPIGSSSCMDKIINGKREERYDFTCLSGYRKINQECVKLRTTKIKTPLEILDTYVSAASVAFDIKDVNLSQDEVYFMECIEIGNDLYRNNPRQIRQQIPNNPSGHIQMMVGMLKSNTQYNCYAAIKKTSGQYVRHTGQKTIFTKPTQSISNFSPPAEYENEVETDNYNNPFSDTNINTLEGKAALNLYHRAIIGGFPDGEFKGIRYVNRAEAAKFLLLAKKINVLNLKNNGKFWDVKEGEWYVKYVMTAAQKGIINGHPDGSFKPADPVNTVEFLKMLTLTFDLEKNINFSYTDVKQDDWFAKYVGTAEKYNLFPNRYFNKIKPSTQLTRNEVAVAIYKYLSN